MTKFLLIKPGSEDELQMMGVRWMQNAYPKVLIYSIPSGGKRSHLTAVRMKITGQKAGMPDLVIAEARGGHFGLYIEMKSAKGKLQTNQKEILELLKEKGYGTAVCYSFEEFKSVVSTYLRQKLTSVVLIDTLPQTVKVSSNV